MWTGVGRVANMSESFCFTWHMESALLTEPQPPLVRTNAARKTHEHASKAVFILKQRNFFCIKVVQWEAHCQSVLNVGGVKGFTICNKGACHTTQGNFQ